MSNGVLFSVLIAVVLAISVAVVMKTNKRNKALQQDGKIINRQASFWEYAEYFLTDVSYEALRRVLMNTDLRDMELDVTPDLDGKAEILFRCKRGWNASVRWQGTREGKNVFLFGFIVWKTMRYGTPYGLTEMNMLMTRLEQIFLSMDPDTAVESRRMQTKTKRSFI